MYAQPTKTNDILCSLQSSIFLRTTLCTGTPNPRGYSHNVTTATQRTTQPIAAATAGAITGVTWYASTTKGPKLMRQTPDRTTATNKIGKPVALLILLTNSSHAITHKSDDHIVIEELINIGVGKGWTVAKADLSVARSFSVLTQILLCIPQPHEVPVYLFANANHVDLSLDVGDERQQYHGIVMVGGQQNQHGHSYPTRVPTLLMPYLNDERSMLAECCQNPSILVIYTVPNVDRRKGNIHHSPLPKHVYETWMARCAVTFMEATTMYREGQRGFMSRL
jgi:hypothetical protein